MKIDYRITDDDYVRAAQFHAWRRLTTRLPTKMLVAAAILLVPLGFLLWKLPMLWFPLVGAFLGFIIVSGISQFIYVPSQARKHYRQYKGIDEPITLELLDDGVSFRNADGGRILPWPKIMRWRQNDRFILIYRMPILFHIVPKSIGSDGFDVALLARRLVAHVGAER